MQVTRRSAFSGKVHTCDLPVTEQQMIEYTNGKPLKEAFPDLTDDQLEFILTGVISEEYSMREPHEDFLWSWMKAIREPKKDKKFCIN